METQKIRITNEITIEATTDKAYGLLINNENASKGFGITEKTILYHKGEKKDQLVENKHWVSREVQTDAGKRTATFWTLRGIMRLQLYIQTEQAPVFGSWAESAIFDNTSIDIVGRETLLIKEVGLKAKVKSQQTKVDQLDEVIELNQLKKELKEVRNSKSKLDTRFMSGVLETWKHADVKSE